VHNSANLTGIIYTDKPMTIFHISYFIFHISCLFIQVVFLWLYAIGLRNARKDTKKADIQTEAATNTITILICARNEAVNLSRFLPSILRQHIPDGLTCEILVVDDDSQDNSANILTQMRLRLERGFAPRMRDGRGARKRVRQHEAAGVPSRCGRTKCDKQRRRYERQRTPNSSTAEAQASAGMPKTLWIGKNKQKSKKSAPNCKNNPQLRILRLPNKTNGGKKYALAQGVAAARGQWILVTDADCRPLSRFWLANMWQTAQSSANIDFVLGFSPYMPTRKRDFRSTWLNMWLRFEAVFTLTQYASAAFWGLPYMGVGRNMMYRKAVFSQQYDWRKNADLASGDDDLFVNALANAGNTRLCLQPRAWVGSQASSTWGSYYRQKRRHFSAGTRYRWQHKLMLALGVQSHIWAWLLLLPALLLPAPYIYYLFIFIILRIFVFFAVMRAICRKFGSADLGWRIFIFDAALPVFYLAFAPILMFGTKIKTWN